MAAMAAGWRAGAIFSVGGFCFWRSWKCSGIRNRGLPRDRQGEVGVWERYRGLGSVVGDRCPARDRGRGMLFWLGGLSAGSLANRRCAASDWLWPEHSLGSSLRRPRLIYQVEYMYLHSYYLTHLINLPLGMI